jgi:hypothetical protein
VLGGGYWGFMVYTEVLWCASDEELAREAGAGEGGATSGPQPSWPSSWRWPASRSWLTPASPTSPGSSTGTWTCSESSASVTSTYPRARRGGSARSSRLYRSDQVPRGVKESGMRVVHHTLRELARVLLPIYYSRPWGYLVVHSVS